MRLAAARFAALSDEDMMPLAKSLCEALEVANVQSEATAELTLLVIAIGKMEFGALPALPSLATLMEATTDVQLAKASERAIE